MILSRSTKQVLAGTAVFLALAILGGPVEGQILAERPAGPQFGLGYVVSAPEEMAGGGAYVILPTMGGIGLYVDAKFDIENPKDRRGYDAGVTAEYVENVAGGDYVRKESSWWGVNAAIVRPLSPYLMVYGGGGVAHRTLFRLYDVVESGVGFGGEVWADDPRGEESRVNLMAGLLLRLSSLVSTHFGLETQPRGMTVGASLRLPAW